MGGAETTRRPRVLPPFGRDATPAASSPPLLLAGILTAAASLAAVPAILLAVRKVQQWVRDRTSQRPSAPPYPPGPKGHVLLGNLVDFPDATKGGQLDKKLLEWSLEFGLVYTLRIPLLGPMIVCADPALAKHVAVTRNHRKSPHTYRQLRPILGSESLVTLEGKEWAAKRKSFNPGFASTFLKTMVETMADKLRRLIACVEDDISSGQATHVLMRAQTFTSDVIVTVAFGEDWGGSQPHPARVLLSRISDLVQAIMFRPALQLFGFLHRRQISSYERQLDAEMRAILDRRLRRQTGPSASSAVDICSLALQEIQRDKGQLTEQDKISIAHQLKTFYFAGHDTTAILIAWAVWLLSLHASALDKVRAELVDHDVWVNWETPPTYEQLQACSFLEAVLKEALRMYPPVGGVVRRCSDPMEAFGGYRIGGADVILSAYVLHHHPSLWNDPEAFRPERFLDGSEERLADKFFAFSRGPRDCIGKHFAMVEAKLAVSALVSRYDLECVDPNETILSQITNQPMHGAQIRFRCRGASH